MLNDRQQREYARRVDAAQPARPREVASEVVPDAEGASGVADGGLQLSRLRLFRGARRTCQATERLHFVEVGGIARTRQRRGASTINCMRLLRMNGSTS